MSSRWHRCLLIAVTTWCQRETGSAFAVNAMVENATLELVKGQVDMKANENNKPEIAVFPCSPSVKTINPSCFQPIKLTTNQYTPPTNKQVANKAFRHLIIDVCALSRFFMNHEYTATFDRAFTPKLLATQTR